MMKGLTSLAGRQKDETGGLRGMNVQHLCVREVEKGDCQVTMHMYPEFRSADMDVSGE